MNHILNECVRLMVKHKHNILCCCNEAIYVQRFCSHPFLMLTFVLLSECHDWSAKPIFLHLRLLRATQLLL